jgi:hypothetical protein
MGDGELTFQIPSAGQKLGLDANSWPRTWLSGFFEPELTARWEAAPKHWNAAENTPNRFWVA